MRTVQVPKQVLIFDLFCGTKPLPHRSKNSGREFAEWNHPFTGQFSHPSLVQSSRSIQCMQTVQAPKQVSYLVTCFFFVGPVLRFTNQKIQKENLLGRTNPHLAQFFHYTHISCSKGPFGTCKKSRFLKKFLR